MEHRYFSSVILVIDKIIQLSRFFRVYASDASVEASGQTATKDKWYGFRGQIKWARDYTNSFTWLVVLFFFLVVGIGRVEAQNNGFSVHNTFRNTGNDGDPIVTGLSAGLIGIPGDGWLRLTSNTGNQRGYAYIDKSFTPPLGMSIQFAYRAWAPDGNSNNIGIGLADGISVYLFDGATTFNPGSCGGGLMYSRSYCGGVGGAVASALDGGYVGIGLDEYGNYSCKDAIAFDDNGPGTDATRVANYSSSIAIRGSSPKTVYIGGTNANLKNAFDATLNGVAIGTTTAGNPPDVNMYYRQVRFYLLPTSSYSVQGQPDIPDNTVADDGTVDMLISVFIQTQAGGPFRTVLYNKRLNQRIKVDGTKTFKIGFGASTGGGYSNHDIRDMIAAAPMQLQTINTVTPGTTVVGGGVTYTTVINNTGLHDVVTSSSGSASFTISTTGVDIINPQNIPVGAVINEGNTNPGNLSTTITYNAAASTSGNYVYTVSNFPVGASITLKYNGTINSTAASAINKTSIIPPNGYLNIDPNSGNSYAQTFIQPVLTKPSDITAACSGVALNKSFSSVPNDFTSYTWSRSANANIGGPSNGAGTVLNDVLTNTSGVDQTITYSVTPQITAVVVNADGSSNPNVTNTSTGNSQTFNVTLKSTSGGANPDITVTSFNDGTNLILTASSGLVSPTFTWYKDANKTGGSIGTGAQLTVPLNSKTPAWQVGDSYTYFVTVSASGTCESIIVTKTITIPSSIQPITLTFTDINGTPLNPSQVNGSAAGTPVYLRASLPPLYPAPAGGVTIILSRDGTSTAVSGSDYNVNISPWQIVIPATKSSVTATVFLAKNVGVIGKSSQLTLDGVAPAGYVMGSTPTIQINDTTGNAPGSVTVTISSGTVSETQAITLTASLPSGITTANPLTVTITPAPGFLSGYSVNGAPVTAGTFNVVIPAGAGSISFVVKTVLNNSAANIVYALNGTATDGTRTFTVNSGTLTVTSSGLVLHVDNSVTPTVQVLGGAVTYTTVISNIGVHDLNVGTGSATFSVNVSGVDLATDVNGIVFTSKRLGGTSFNYVSGNGGSYTYTVGNLPAGGSLTLTYVGTMSSTASSGVNLGHILPPPPYVNNDVHRGYGAAQTFLMPVMIQPYDDHTCSGVALNKGFSATPTVYTTYSWTRTDNNANVSTTSFTSPGTVSLDVLTNSTSVSQTVNYSITPQITATIVQYDGSSSGNVQNTLGVGKLFSVLVKDKGVTGADPTAITMNYDNKNGVLVLTPIASSVVHPKFKWYNDAQGTGGSINDGSIDPVTGARSIPIVPPLHVGDTYTWYASVSGDNTCESVIESKSLVIPPVPQPISLTFVNASGGSITSVNGGVPTGDSVYIIASLPAGITATVNGVKVWLTPNVGSSSAINGTDYTNWMTIPVIIPGGATSSTITRVFDAKNRGSIGLSTTLIADASYTTDKNYYIASGSNSPTIKIIDTTGNDVQNRVITIGSGVVTETLSKTLTVSLPNTPLSVTTSAPISVTIISNKVFPGGYGVDVGSGVQSISGSTSFTVVIPANSHSVSYTIYTAANSNRPNDLVFSLAGTATSTLGISFTVNAGVLTVTSIPSDKVFTITPASDQVMEGGSKVYTISRASSGSAVVVSLNQTSSNPAVPPFQISVPSSISFGTSDTSLTFTITTVDGGHALGLYQDFSIGGIAANSLVNSGGLRVLSSKISVDHQFTITPASDQVMEGGSKVYTISRASSGSAVVVSLNQTSSNPAVPPFQISVPSSISFGTSDTSLTFTITTVDGGHALGLYQDFSIGGIAANSLVNSGGLRVLSSKISVDHQFTITPASDQVMEGGSKVYTISRASSGSAVVVSLNQTSSNPAVPPFQISVPSSISFGTSDTSLTFTITTVDGGHALGSYQDFSIGGIAANSLVNSGGLRVLSSKISVDHQFTITPASDQVMEGGSKVYTISRASSGSAVVVSLNQTSSNPAVPPFQISVPSSISFGTSDTSLTFTITTVDGGHALGSYQDFSIGGIAANSLVNSGGLRVLSSKISVDHQFTITPASDQVMEGGSKVYTISRASSGSAVVVSLNQTSSNPAVPPFQISVPSSISFGTSDTSLTFTITTVDGGHALGSYQDFSIGGIAANSLVNSGGLRVLSSKISVDHQFTITPASDQVMEGGSKVYTISRASSGSAVVVSLNQTSSNPAVPPFQISVPSSISFGTSDTSLTFTITTVDGGHALGSYQDFSIGGIAANSLVNSGGLRVLSSKISVDHQFTITPASDQVMEGGSKVYTISRASSGSAVVVSLNQTSSNPAVPPFQISVPSSISFGTSDTSLTFTITTVDGGHALGSYQDFSIGGIAANSLVNSGGLRVLSSKISVDHQFTITPASDQVMEGGSKVYTISRASSGSAVVVSLNQTSSNPAVPPFQISVPSSISFGTSDTSLTFTITTVDGGHALGSYQDFSIGGIAANSLVNSGGLRVLSSKISVDHQFTITPASDQVMEGRSKVYTISRASSGSAVVVSLNQTSSNPAVPPFQISVPSSISFGTSDTSLTFTITTVDGGHALGSYQDFSIGGIAANSLVNSGGLRVLSSKISVDHQFTITPASDQVMEGGSKVYTISRASSGSAVVVSLNQTSSNPAVPPFQISVPSSISFGTSDTSLTFTITTVDGGHALGSYQDFSIGGIAANSLVNSGGLRVLSSKISVDHQFTITPASDQVMEGGSKVYTISRASSGSAVVVSLNQTSSNPAVPPFQISVPSSISFGTSDTSLTFTITTVDGGHALGSYQDFSIGGIAANSLVNSGGLRVLSSKISVDHQFTITPASDQVMEGGSKVYTISRASSGSAVVVSLNQTSSNPAVPPFQISVPSSISFGTSDTSLTFTITTVDGGHALGSYQDFSIGGIAANSLVNSGGLRVLSSKISVDHQFTITPASDQVMEGGSKVYTISRASSGSAVVVSLNQTSSNPAVPPFQISVPSSISFGTSDTSLTFTITTVDGGHALGSYQDFSIGGIAANSLVNSGGLRVLSSKISVDHQFTITPASDQVMEGGSKVYTISRASSGSAVVVSLNQTSSNPAVPPFQISVPSSISFGTSDTSLTFTITTVDGGHALGSYQDFSIGGIAANSLVNSGGLRVLSSKISVDHQFTITPASDQVMEGRSKVYTISRASSGSAVVVSLNQTSSNPAVPPFQISVPSSISFGTSDTSLTFTITTVDGGHALGSYQDFSIGGIAANSLVNSGGLRVLSSKISVDHQFTITPASDQVMEGGSKVYTISRASSGSAVVVSLNQTSSNPAVPPFQISVPSSISFGTSDMSLTFTITTVDGGHALGSYQDFSIGGIAANSLVNSGGLRVLSSKISVDHQFTITPASDQVMEGGSKVYTISRASSGSAVVVSLNQTSSNPAVPPFQISVPSSISFGTSDTSLTFTITTVDGGHALGSYQDFSIGGIAANSLVNSGGLRVLSSKISVDHQFTITPASDQVMEGGSKVYTISRASSGSAVVVSLNQTSSNPAVPPFQISVPSSISFGTSDTSLTFTITTVDGGHALGSYQDFSIGGIAANSLVNSGGLRVLSSKISVDHQFTITPASDQVMEGGSKVYTISRASSGSAVVVSLNQTSSNPAVPPFQISVPSSISFGTSDTSLTFTITTVDGGHALGSYQDFSIGGIAANSLVNSGGLRVLSSKISVDHQFTITPASDQVMEGGSKVYTISRASSGSAVVVSLNQTSSNPAVPPFQISVPSSISFGTSDTSLTFTIMTVDGGHALGSYQDFSIGGIAANSLVNSGGLRVLSSKISVDHQFTITPASDQVMEGGSKVYTISRASSGSAVVVSLNQTSSNPAVPPFQISVPSSISFGTSDTSLTFTITTVDGGHALGSYQDFSIGGIAANSLVNSGGLRVLSSKISVDHQFTITPASDQVMEGGSKVYTISRASSGSAVVVSLNQTSSNPAVPPFQISVPSSISFGTSDTSLTFTITTVDGGHALGSYQDFSIGGIAANSLVNSGGLRVLSSKISVDHQFTITPASDQVMEGGSKVYTISRASSGSAVVVSLNQTSSNPAVPPFQISVPSSISFGTSDTSLTFTITTVDGGHALGSYQDFSIGGIAANSLVNSGGLRVLSSKISVDHQFTITPASDQVMEGGSKVYTISRASSGSAVVVSLNQTSSNPAVPPFQISVPSSISFGTSDTSLTFTITTVDGGHALGLYQDFSIGGIAANSLVNSGGLRVLSSKISVDHQFTITPASDQVMEGRSKVYTISRASSGSAVVVSLNQTSSNPAVPPFQISVPSSISFGTSDTSLTFTITTVDGGHALGSYQDFSIGGIAANSLVNSGGLRVLSSKISVDHQFTITPASDQVMEGGSKVYTISRASSGSAVVVSLNQTSSNPAVPPFQISVPSSISFGTSDTSLTFTITTVDGGHALGLYQDFSIGGIAANSLVNSGGLRVLSSKISVDHQFTITPAFQSVIEGSGVSFTITRLASGSQVTLDLNMISSNLVHPDFSASLVGSTIISFGSGETSKVFSVTSTNMGHMPPSYELFTISGHDTASPGGSVVSSGVLKVLPYNKLTFTVSNGVSTGASVSVIEGNSVTLKLSSSRAVMASEGDAIFNIVRDVVSTNGTVLESPLTITVGNKSASFTEVISLSNTVGEDEELIVDAIDPLGIYTNINSVTITVYAYPVVSVRGPISTCSGASADLNTAISNYNTSKYSYTYYNSTGQIVSNVVSAIGVYTIYATNLRSGLRSKVGGSVTVTINSKIAITLIPYKAVICGNGVVDLNSYIQGISPGLISGTYLRTFKNILGLSISDNGSGEYLVSNVGDYTIIATDPNTGCSGSTVLHVGKGSVPVLSVTSPITHYSQVPVDLTDPSVTVGSTNVDHYNYYSDALGTLVLSNPKAITVAGTYYIQGVGPEGCTSTIAPVVVIDGGPLTVELRGSTAVLNEGDSGTFTLSLYDSGHNPAHLQKVETFVFTQDNSDGNTEKAGHCRISGSTTFPFTVNLAGGLDHVDLPIDALKDKILYNTELLVLEGTNVDLGSVTSSMKIVDETSMDPNNLVITIGDGSIYHSGTISVTVSLPSGVTTAVPLDISLVQGSGSILSGVPAPVFPSDAFIGANSGVGYINVSGSNMRDDDVPAVLILEGSSTGFKVNPGTITIYNKRIHAFMSVSANGDNIHDYSEIQNIERYPDNEVDIIDRWGVLVWRVKGYNNQDNVFRGRSNRGNGYDLPEGTYYYVIRFYDETGEINIFKGSLQLKRGTSER